MRLYLELRYNLWSAKRQYRRAQKNEQNFAAKIADFKAKIASRNASPEIAKFLAQMEEVHRQILASLVRFKKQIDAMQKTLEALNA